VEFAVILVAVGIGSDTVMVGVLSTVVAEECMVGITTPSQERKESVTHHHPRL